MNRYNRHIVLSDIGQQGQSKLLDAHVLVIGAGGLGCPVLQYLTAVGIGSIGIIDFDIVEESNLQRQVLFGTSSLGMNKAIAAKERLEDLNPTINIIAYPKKLTSKNAKFLFDKYDIIVDGSDNFSTRYLINDTAILTSKPVVYAAIYKYEGQVSVFNYKNGPSYRCLFPIPPKEGSVANCSEVGVLGVLPGIIGSMQANEVIKVILDFEGVLSGKLLCFNSKTSESTFLKIAKSKNEFEKVLNNQSSILDDYLDDSCNVTSELGISEVLKMDNYQFIDVREPHEEPSVSLSNGIQIPLRILDQQLELIDSDRISIVFCQTGIRSKQAVKLLKQHHINNCYSLKEGANGIIKELKLNI